MPSFAQILTRILLVTQSAWMLAPAQAQPAQRARPKLAHVHHKQHLRHVEGVHALHRRMHERTEAMVSVPTGGFFGTEHQEIARAFYTEPEHQGYCAPGLKTDCVPALHKKSWRRGQPLPASVARYSLPLTLEVRLGPPPAGHHYARVGADIVLLTRGTSEVVDALENLVR